MVPDESLSVRCTASPGEMTQCGLMACSPKVCTPEGGLRAGGACTHFSFPLALQELGNTHHLCLHLFIIIKYYSLGLLMCVAPSSSILLQFPSSLPFLFLACSQCTDFFLWLPTVNIIPTHSIKDLLFQKWHPTGGAVCPDRAFLAHRLGSHLVDPPKYWKDFIMQQSIP